MAWALSCRSATFLTTKEVARPTKTEVFARAAQRDERASASSVNVIRQGRDERDADAGRRTTMIVIDCSAVVDALSSVDGTAELRALLEAEDLHAPGLIDAEVVSALRGLTLERWPAGDALRRRALALRDDLTAYDATYVALAEALDCPLITRDERLARTRGHHARIDVV